MRQQKKKCKLKYPVGKCMRKNMPDLSQDQGAAGSSLTGVTVLWSLGKTHLS